MIKIEFGERGGNFQSPLLFITPMHSLSLSRSVRFAHMTNFAATFGLEERLTEYLAKELDSTGISEAFTNFIVENSLVEAVSKCKDFSCYLHIPTNETLVVVDSDIAIDHPNAVMFHCLYGDEQEILSDMGIPCHVKDTWPYECILMREGNPETETAIQLVATKAIRETVRLLDVYSTYNEYVKPANTYGIDSDQFLYDLIDSSLIISP